MSELMDRRPQTAHGAGSPPTRTSVWLLPPWRRAPLLGLQSLGAFLAVLVTAAILACALASAPLFLSSARSAAMQQELAPQCAEHSWPSAGAGIGPFFGAESPTGAATPERMAGFAQRYTDAWAALGRTSRRSLLVDASGSGAGGEQSGMLVLDRNGAPLSQAANLLWRPGALQHVPVVQGSTATGVWLPASYAESAGATVGSRITMAGVAVTVAGVYTDLFKTDYGAYWCAYTDLFLNLVSANTPPPALVLATDQQTAFRVAAAAGFLGVNAAVPVDATTLSVTQADGLLAEQNRVARRATPVDVPSGGGVNQYLAEAVEHAKLTERGLQGPVIPVAVAGGLLALVLVAAAGSFWADRRITEVRLLAARGVGPVALGGKAALELALPALLGAALGWGASRLLITGLGPADDLDPWATRAARLVGVAAFAVGLLCAATVAGLRARSTAERPMGRAPQWPAKVPWELALLGAAAWCWALLDRRDAVVIDGGVAQVNGLLVAFPLLGLAGAAVLLTRLITTLLPALRRWAGRRAPAVFMALNRLAAARLATATLLVAVTLPVAVLGYTATLTASSRLTVDAKTGVQIGAENAVVSVDRIARTPRTAAIGTVVDRYVGSAVLDGDRTDVQVLGVDPRTFARTAYWRGSFADESLDELVARLDGPAVDGRLPVVAQGLPTGDAQLRVGRRAVPAEVVATARVLPGRRLPTPMVLVAANRLPDITREYLADRTSELWTEGAVGPAIKALTAEDARVTRTVSSTDVFTTANFLGITWTFGYLSALAVFVGIIAAGGLLLYLEARSRVRVSGYVMARRLGLSRRGHLGSVLTELGGVAVTGLVLGGALAVAAVAAVYRRLDVDLIRPPTPLLAVPWVAIGATALAALVVAALGALYAQHAADRADPATVLREDA
jgi:putative ABC transport system permease protein